MLQNAIAAAAVALVASAIYAAARSRGRARQNGERPRGAAADGVAGPQPEGEELIAVIAAAIAAASGAAEDSFRIVGIAPSRPEASGAAPAFASRFRARASHRASARRSGGLNTPAWGHVDRFELGE
jgi:hypothetical protein